MKSIIKNVLKLAFAIFLISWLLKSGKLDFNLVTKSFDQGYYWLICLILLIVQGIIASYRWFLLISIKSSVKLSIFDVIKVSWIGMFFNSILPGAVTGDLIKLVYARDLDKKLERSFLITSVLLDRILGLVGLLTVLGVSCIFNYSAVTAISVEIKHLIHINLLLFLGGLIFLSMLFLPHYIQDKILNLINIIPFLGTKISKLIKSFWIIGENKIITLKVYLISIVVQFMNLIAFWMIIYPFLDKNIAVSHLFTFIPSGLIAVAIPISPAGMGVGHVIFDKLFSYIGVEGGASFFNLFFICIIFVNFLGIIPYLLHGKKHSINETRQFDELS